MKYILILIAVLLLVLVAIAQNQHLDQQCDYTKTDWWLAHTKGGWVYCLDDK